MPVYLIHFDEKVAGRAGHYMGYATDVDKRLKCHASGNGAALMAEVRRLGINWQCVRIWKNGNRTFERRLKRRKNHPALCPLCNPQGWHRNASEKGTPDEPL